MESLVAPPAVEHAADRFAAALGGDARGSGRPTVETPELLHALLRGYGLSDGELTVRHVDVPPLVGGGMVRVAVLTDTSGRLLAHATGRHSNHDLARLTPVGKRCPQALLDAAAADVHVERPMAEPTLMKALAADPVQRVALVALGVANRDRLLKLVAANLTDRHVAYLRALDGREGESRYLIGQSIDGFRHDKVEKATGDLFARGLVRLNFKGQGADGLRMFFTDDGREVLAQL